MWLWMPPRRDDPLALGQVAGAREGEILGHDAVADDLLGAVDVGEVGVEGVDALRVFRAAGEGVSAE